MPLENYGASAGSMAALAASPANAYVNALNEAKVMQQRQQALDEASQRTQIYGQQQQQGQASEQHKQELQQGMAKLEWMLKEQDLGALLQSDPQKAAGLSQMVGVDLLQVDEPTRRQALERLRGHLASQLGIGPPEDKQPSGAMYKTVGPNGLPYYAAADGQPRFPAYQEPERPQSYQPTEAPADQRLFGWFNQLPPEQQAAFLNMKRANATPEMAGQVAGAKATATEHAKSTSAAQADLPRVETNADDMLQALGTLEKSPGFKYLWGAYSIAPVVPGTPQADAAAVWEQVQGKAFLEAFGTLKGGGQITEKEGEKATAAITRLSNRRQSPESALAAIRELRNIVNAGRARARQKAAQSPAQSSAQPPESQPREVNFEDL